MGKRARGKGITAAAVRVARAAAVQQDEQAAQVSQRVYNAIVESKRTGEAGDVSPLMWGPLAVAGEMMAVVVARANGLPQDEDTITDLAAYFVAGLLAGGHGFDFEHFEGWRRRSEQAHDAGTEL
ncbi:MAG: hypothetical protein ACRDMZ_04470 [Solirubrobacteraceae bacterium]